MKNTSDSSLWSDLSAFADGALDDTRADALRRKVAEDPAAARELEELNRLRRAVGRKARLPENEEFFGTLESRLLSRVREDVILFRAPRRYQRSSISIAAAAFLILCGLLYTRWDDVLHYVNRRSAIVEKTYKERVLKGWIMPLFDRTDKDQALQFAMFGTIPLDKQDGPVLRVDNTTEKGYHIDLGTAKPAAHPVTVADMCRHIRATDEQRKTIDSLLAYAQEKIEASVLMSDNETIAIDPALTKFNTVILASLASALEVPQRERLVEFLETRNTPYTIRTAPTVPPVPSHVILDGIRSSREPSKFVMVTADTVELAKIDINIDSVRRNMTRLEREIPSIAVRVNAIARKLARGQWQAREPFPPPPPDEENTIVRIEVESNALQRMARSIPVAVQKLALKEKIMRHVDQSPHAQFHVTADSTIFIEEKVERALREAFEKGMPNVNFKIETRTMDGDRPAPPPPPDQPPRPGAPAPVYRDKMKREPSQNFYFFKSEEDAKKVLKQRDEEIKRKREIEVRVDSIGYHIHELLRPDASDEGSTNDSGGSNTRSTVIEI